MSLTLPLFQIRPRTLFALFGALFGVLIFLPPFPAHALDSRAFGDVVVKPGTVEDNVSTTFGDVLVEGPVTGDVHSASGDIEILRRVGGDVNSGWGDVEVRAPVEGEIEAGFGDVYIDAPVGGDVDVGRGDLSLGPSARIAGDVNYASGEFRPDPHAVVGGNIMTGMASGFDDPKDFDGSPLLGLVGWALVSLVFVACAVLAAVLMPGPVFAASRSLESSPGWSFLLGVGSVPVMILLSVLLAVSVVGIPVLLLLAPAYLALILFGALVTAFFIGRKVVMVTGRYRAGNVLAAVVGALIVAAAYLIPVLGSLLLYALAFLGTGAAILALFSRRRPRPYDYYESYIRGRRGG